MNAQLEAVAKKIFEPHIHAYAPAADGTMRCVRCDKKECGHNDSHLETRVQPASRDYFGWTPESEYTVSVCNVCHEESRTIQSGNWNLVDDLPF